METMLQCWLAVACRDAAVKVQRLLATELVDHEGLNPTLCKQQNQLLKPTIMNMTT